MYVNKVFENLIVRDVNGVDMVRVVAPPYLTCWINICPIPVPISVGYLLCGYPPIFSYLRVSTGTCGYLQKYLKKQIFNHN